MTITIVSCEATTPSQQVIWCALIEKLLTVNNSWYLAPTLVEALVNCSGVPREPATTLLPA